MLLRFLSNVPIKLITVPELHKELNPLLDLQNYLNSRFLEGKLSGSYRKKDNTYVIEHLPTNLHIGIRLNSEFKEESVSALCFKYLKSYNLKNNLMINQYCFHEDNNGLFLEVRTNTHNFFCDIQDLYLLFKSTWLSRKKEKLVFCQRTLNGTQKKIFFHRVIFGKAGIVGQIVHADGNTLNNRRKNLIVLTNEDEII